jgi:hypothetical protein
MSYDDPMQVLTRYGLDALDDGRKEDADTAFQARDVIANQDQPGHSLTDLKDAIFEIEGGPAWYGRLGANADEKLRRAMSLIFEDDELRAELAGEDHEEQLDTLADAVEAADQMGYPADPNVVPDVPTARDPSNLTRQDALDAIDEILEKYPIESPGWRTHKIQNRLSYLYGLAHGEAPIVGTHMRVV